MSQQTDTVIAEEPLEINLFHGAGQARKRQNIAVTMRTPGDDAALALGFLYTEGIIHRTDDILEVEMIGENVIQVVLHPDLRIDTERLNRHFYTSSSCGVCGKASIEMVQQQSSFLLHPKRPLFDLDQLLSLPSQLLERKSLFSQTGGNHSVLLLGQGGEIAHIAEDVGRHNAMDKLIGYTFQSGQLPLQEHLLLLSGRISFELVQKALMAGVGFIAAIGAPSSLAIALAEENGMTLVGFLKEDQFNVYCGAQRIGLTAH